MVTQPKTPDEPSDAWEQQQPVGSEIDVNFRRPVTRDVRNNLWDVQRIDVHVPPGTDLKTNPYSPTPR